MKHDKQEKQVIDMLERQRKAVQAPEHVLWRILAQIPVPLARQEERWPWLWWMKFAVPVGAALLVGGIFWSMQTSPTPEQGSPRAALLLDLSAIAAEEKGYLKQDEELEGFFEEDMQMQEVYSILIMDF